MLERTPDKVLIVTGGLLSLKETSASKAVRRQIAAFRGSSGAWLDIQVKLLAAEELAALSRFRKSPRHRNADYHDVVEAFFAHPWNFDPPELTEVALMTLLDLEGIPYEAATFAELHTDPARREALLDACPCVFLSTTFLRDLSELEPLAAMLKREHNQVVAGGALSAILYKEWPGVHGVDVLAVGYGELLVPALADWIRGGYETLTPPESGRMEHRADTTILHSGVPRTKSLDDLPSPNWRLASDYHGRTFPMVHYESVRGCPYRCAFCNYPFLFDDTKFRMRSAERIADDWAAYAAQGIEFVTCLDSLFTMPKRRLVALCNLLIERSIAIKWICYARADDLDDLETCRLMKAAGCHEVQIGIESGDQDVLANMNKRCTVEKNALALRNCREVGITSVVTVMVGFPGETDASLMRTYEMLRDSPPDFFYTAPFNTRVEKVPILSDESRERFGITTVVDGRSSQPYWRHDTMCSSEVGEKWAWLTRRLMEDGVALAAGLFYKGVLGYRPEDREMLLTFQKDVATSQTGLRRLFGIAHRWAQRRLTRDVKRHLGEAA